MRKRFLTSTKLLRPHLNRASCASSLTFTKPPSSGISHVSHMRWPYHRRTSRTVRIEFDGDAIAERRLGKVYDLRRVRSGFKLLFIYCKNLLQKSVRFLNFDFGSPLIAFQAVVSFAFRKFNKVSQKFRSSKVSEPNVSNSNVSEKFQNEKFRAHLYARWLSVPRITGIGQVLAATQCLSSSLELRWIVLERERALFVVHR